MYIEAEFFTSEHVVQGYVDTPQERLTDFLNWKNETTIIIRDAQISRLVSLGKTPPIIMTDARMEKSAILLAHPIERDITTKSLFRRTTRLAFPISVLLPSFELIGHVHLTEKLEIRRVLLSRPEDFIPMTDAIATYTLYPSVTVGKGTIIFNKTHMYLIGEREPSDSLSDPLKPPSQGPK